MTPSHPAAAVLPPLDTLLLAGGDARLGLDASTGRNIYQCGPAPDDGLLAFGSSTASTISTRGWAAAAELRQNLLTALDQRDLRTVWRTTAQGIARRIGAMLGVSADCQITLAPSGTDSLAIAVQASIDASAHSHVILNVAQAETGSHLPAAIARAAEPDAIELREIAVRDASGLLRHAAYVDADFAREAVLALASHREVLLILTDQSKSGLIVPSVECALYLQRRFDNRVRVVVDACQARLSPQSVGEYLRQGWGVAITGSKFWTGPAFSGAFLAPWDRAAGTTAAPPPCGNSFGSLLRWEAALAEAEPFYSHGSLEVGRFLRRFASSVHARAARPAALRLLPHPGLVRSPLQTAGGWDTTQTIFPFLALSDAGRRPHVSQSASRRLYEAVREPCLGTYRGRRRPASLLLGQPVALSPDTYALRLSSSARLVNTALEQSRGEEQILDQLAQAFDRLRTAAAQPPERPGQP